MFVTGTFCGVFRRQALDRGAILIGCNKVVTGLIFLLTYLFVLKSTSCQLYKRCVVAATVQLDMSLLLSVLLIDLSGAV